MVFSTLKPEILEKWYVAARLDGVPEEAYKPGARIVTASDSGYSFGVIHNEYRFRRLAPDNNGDLNSCNMCTAVSFAMNECEKNLFPNEKLLDFIITNNKYPIHRGISLAITKQERDMYTTRDLSPLVEELKFFLDLSERTGFELYHNSPGFGATIPNHEHWHLTNFRSFYDDIGETYGFDAAEKEQSKKTAKVSFMPEFPFAHAIFSKDDPERIIDFLSNVHRNLSTSYREGSIPHTLSEGYDGILITVGKSHLAKSRGSGDVAGHLVFRLEEDYNNTTHEACMSEIDKLLFRREDLDLERFI